ncbi:UDP-N-acetylmuramoyl-tripeptide--D-alanyl-D-alanine ligase [Robbsia sp. KACC 23696]|uniref:UDP-N-acetylmuramoyl-tripeptide--D-alanyl-D- alanine ligase n=1 Tax=Robbsia sp. KACC 23696 TaxID=3149231 RepID=UPI00325A69C5
MTMFTLAQAAQWIEGARLVGLASEDAAASITIERVVTDSRQAGPGDLFVALRGDRFDAHDFLDAVAAQRVGAAIVSRAPDAFAAPYVLVPDTRRALGELARGWRRTFAAGAGGQVAAYATTSGSDVGRAGLPIVAVTGSNGKTTVKEMIASIFAAAVGADHCLATRGNFNNDIGLPLTLLRLRATDRLAVIELGMNHPDETRYLAGICEPTIGLVNNAQREHQEFMHTVEAVALEHASVIHALPADGTAVYPADDAYAAIWRVAAHTRRIIDFALLDDLADGQSGRSETRAAVTGRWRLGQAGASAASDAARGAEGSLEVETPIGAFSVVLQTQGRHNLRNALAATAAAVAAGVGIDAIRTGLQAFAPVKGRLQVKRATVHALAGADVIDDSYNANPDSMRAAIDVLVQAASPRVLVVGDMGEVGDQETAAHREIGAYAFAQGVDRLYALGQASRGVRDAFEAARAKADHASRDAMRLAEHFESTETLVAALLAATYPAPASKVTVLVKGSRFMAMENVVAALVGETAAAPH